MRPNKRKKRWLVAIADTLLLAFLLGVFAIQHYTPNKQDSLGIVSNIPQVTQSVTSNDSENGQELAADSTEQTAEETSSSAESTESCTEGENTNFGSSENSLARVNVSNLTSLSATGAAANYLASSSGLSARQGWSRYGFENENPTAVDVSTESAVSTAKAQNYTADGVKISVQQLSTSDGRVEYILADLQLSDVTLLKTAFAYDTYGTGYTDTVPNMDSLLNAILTVNGDYYGNGSSGVVARNGVIYRANPTNSDILLLYANGEMAVKSYKEFDAQAEANAGLWQAWTFGPSLLDENGKAITNFNVGGHLNSRNPRTVIGYYENGHYGILVINGRGDSEGLSLTELSALCEKIGFKVAYNLDGGKSSVMVYADEVINEPASGGRAISDVIYIAEGA